jgi:hypothetical protein
VTFTPKEEALLAGIRPGSGLTDVVLVMPRARYDALELGMAAHLETVHGVRIITCFEPGLPPISHAERLSTYYDESFPLPWVQHQPVVVPAPLVYKTVLAIVAVMKGARV